MSSVAASLLLRALLCFVLYALCGFEVWLVMASPDMTERQASTMNQMIGATLTMAIAATMYFFGTSKGSTDAVQALQTSLVQSTKQQGAPSDDPAKQAPQ